MRRLPNLPDPQAIVELSHDNIVNDMVADLIVEFAEEGVSYDVGNIEPDPAKRQIRTYAYRETLVRSAINDGLKSNLLGFAEGSDLDHFAAGEGVERFLGESDFQLFRRCALAIRVKSGAGPKALYELTAMNVGVDVRSAYAYRPGRGPKIEVAIVSHSNDGVASNALLSQVEAALNDEDVRVYSDALSAVSATKAVVNVAAEIWLLPNTPYSVFEGLESHLRTTWLLGSDFGRDLAHSWLSATLHGQGIASVKDLTPEFDVVSSKSEIISLGEIALRYGGRSQ